VSEVRRKRCRKRCMWGLGGVGVRELGGGGGAEEGEEGCECVYGGDGMLVEVGRRLVGGKKRIER